MSSRMNRRNAPNHPRWVSTLAIFTLVLLCCIAFAGGKKSAAKVENEQALAPQNAPAPDSTASQPSLLQQSGPTTVKSDDFWTNISASNRAAQSGDQDKLKAYRVLELNRAAFSRSLAKAPMEFIRSSGPVEISLPLPDGRLWRFRVEESPVLAPELAANFPEIKTYNGQGIDSPTATARFSWTPQGLNAFVISEEGSFLVAPYGGTTDHYLTYFARDLEVKPLTCLTPNDSGNGASGYTAGDTQSDLTITGATLRRYRLAVTVTPDFIFNVGGEAVAGQGTVNAVTNYVNNVRAIYEREIGVSFNLVAVWNPAAFGVQLTNGNLEAMDQQNQFFLDNLFFGTFAGSASYDVGFAMGYSPQGPSGRVSSFGNDGLGEACQNSIKAQGAALVTGPAGNDYWGTMVVAHEIGHMFGGRHTFTPVTSMNCSAQADPLGMVEPGSGSTIMAYAALCGTDMLFTNNPRFAADSNFHVHSLIKIANHKAAYSFCGQSISTGNSPPVLNSAGSNATIPALTPFTLTASASDPNGDPLTYSWEQYDPGTTLFRAYPPTSSSSRTFPSLPYILQDGNMPPIFIGSFFSGEAIPSTTRALNFTVTVRDSRSGGGGTVARDQLLQVNVVGGAGPFKVTQPNTPVTMSSGAQNTITWNVASTNIAPINTSSVRILLSTDGGNTFPTVLANSTPNDGSEVVTLPSVITSTARIKIEAVGNIYFDISDTNFIISNTSPNLTPFKPTGWADKIVISNTTGANTDSTTLRTTDTLYIDWAVINNGTGATGATFYTKLFIDGVERTNWFSDPPLNVNFYSFIQDYSIGSLSVGTHTIKIVADATGTVSESNESDNEYMRTITVVSGAQPNLTPFQPTGWSDKIVLSKTTGTNTDSASLISTDTLYVDWAVLNNGDAPTSATFQTKLYVDGVERQFWTSPPPLNQNFYNYIQDYSIGTLSAGQHTIKIVSDTSGAVAEKNELDNEYTKVISVAAAPTVSTIQLSAQSYSFNESTVNTAQGFGTLSVTVVRTDATSTASVQFATSDASGGNECNQVTGQASQRCDYAAQGGTLRFAAGESSKTLQIPVISDGYIEGPEIFFIKLQNPAGATLGLNSQATITIVDRGVATLPSANPYLSNEFFVRMNYLDFLGREPDAGGWSTWPPLLNTCGPEKGFLGAPYNCDRAHVSHGFYASPEFTNRGFLVYRLYEVGMGRLPRYVEFIPDMASLSGFGLSDAIQQQNLQDYLQNFTAKQEFINRFSDALLASQATVLIQKLEQASGVVLPATATTLPGQPQQYGRQELINLRVNGIFTVGQTLKAFIEQQPIYDMYFPRGAVTMEYFAYLKRDPDLNDPNLLGWKEWVFVFTNGGAARGRPDIAPRDIHHLIFGFIYSEEYRKRFGAP